MVVKSDKLNVNYPSKNQGESFNSWANEITSSMLSIEKYGIHNNAYQEIFSIAEKEIPNSNDIILIEDSEDGYSKKKVRFSNFPPGTYGIDENAIRINESEGFLDITKKGSYSDDDYLIIEDSEDNYAKKKIKIKNLNLGGELYYIEETYSSTSCYYQLNYIPSSNTLGNINVILKVFKNRSLIKYDADSLLNSWYFDESNNCVVFENNRDGYEYLFYYWTDGTIYSGVSPLPECPVYFEEDQILTVTGSNDSFGYAIDAENDICAIGAYFDGGSKTGAVYIFTNSGGTWSEAQRLVASDGGFRDSFGSALSLYGDYCIISSTGDDDLGLSSGSAYVFTNSGGTWSETQKLTASDGVSGDYFGNNVSLYGDYCVITAYGANTYTGKGYIFTNNSGTLSELQILIPTGLPIYSFFGTSSSMYDGDCMIGVQTDSNAGMVYYYKEAEGVFVEEQIITSDDISASDLFGSSIDIYNDYCIIGARGKNSSTGAAYIFKKILGVWHQQQKLTATVPIISSYFGSKVKLYSNFCVIGAFGAGGNFTGAAYVFTKSGDTFSESQKLVASDSSDWAYFSEALAFSNGSLFIGADGADKTYVFNT